MARWAIALVVFAAAAARAQAPVLEVEAPPALAGVADRVRAFDAARLDRALRTAGLKMPPLVRVGLVDEDDPRADGVPRWIVGLAWGDRNVEIFPARIAGYPSDSIESVLRHEIVHLALNEAAGGRPLPRWFQEGVAEAIGSEHGLLSTWRLVGAAAGTTTLADLDARFDSGRERTTADAYRLAVAVVDDVRRTHGGEAIGAIAGRVAAGKSFEQAFVEETGQVPDAAANSAWKPYRRASQWLAVVSSSEALWFFILLLAFVAVGVRLYRRRELRRAWDALDGDG